jgi:hypothetical protein
MMIQTAPLRRSSQDRELRPNDPGLLVTNQRPGGAANFQAGWIRDLGTWDSDSSSHSAEGKALRRE